MFVNENTYNTMFECKCGNCKSKILYGSYNLLVNQLNDNMGTKITLFVRCNKCGNVEKVSR